MVIFMLAVAFHVLAKAGHSNAILEEGYSVVLSSAEAGTERTIWNLTQNSDWRAGYGNPKGDGEPFYYPNSKIELSRYLVTLSTVSQTKNYSIVRITTWAYVKGARLFGVGVGIGVTKKIEELVRVDVNVNPVSSRYAITTGGELNFNANFTIYGSIRSNGPINL